MSIRGHHEGLSSLGLLAPKLHGTSATANGHSDVDAATRSAALLNPGSFIEPLGEGLTVLDEIQRHPRESCRSRPAWTATGGRAASCRRGRQTCAGSPEPRTRWPAGRRPSGFIPSPRAMTRTPSAGLMDLQAAPLHIPGKRAPLACRLLIPHLCLLGTNIRTGQASIGSAIVPHGAGGSRPPTKDEPAPACGYSA